MKYKKGDRVFIKDWTKRPNNWNSQGRMDYMKGTWQTIVGIENVVDIGNDYRIKQKIGDYVWYINPEDIDDKKTVQFKKNIEIWKNLR